MDKQRLLDFLVHLSEGQQCKVISGQNLYHAPNMDHHYDMYVKGIVDTQLKPGMIGVDYGWNSIPDLTGVNELIVDFAKQGGLVTISMHPDNPATDGDVRDRAFHQFEEMLCPGTELNRVWLQVLDKVAAGLKDLENKGVPVLWRPLHEMNGGWFWWASNQDGVWPEKEEFIALWQHMYHYFTNEKKLSNLLWVYSPTVQMGDWTKSADYFYPGDAFVDVVGLDYYWDDMSRLNENRSYSQLLALGKPMGICEIGPVNVRDGSFDNYTVIQGIKEHYPEVAYFLFWHSWTGAKVAMVDNRNFEALMTDDSVISLADLHKLR